MKVQLNDFRKLTLRVEQLEERVVLSSDLFRSIDGTENHPRDLGEVDSPLIRIAPVAYPDGAGHKIITYPDRENPRVISNTVVDQAGASILNNRGLSDFVWQWGQFLDHDIDLTEGHSGNGTANIPVPDGDILGPNPIPFNRSDYLPGSNPRQQVNQITAFIDASNVYGSHDERADNLRTFADGKLKTSDDGRLLPVEGGTFYAGDIRANEQVGLTSMHTLFVREHNRLADALGALKGIDDKADDAKMSRDEYIYQVARKIVGAEMQIITYKEFLPALLGPYAPKAYKASYKTNIDPSIANEFSTAMYRVGHTMLSPKLLLVSQDHRAENLELKSAFFEPEFLGGDDLTNPEDTGNIERLLKGLAHQRMQEIDATIVDDVRNFLFGPPGAGGLDLASLNIQRGRDHGLPDYNAMREAYGLTPKKAFLDRKNVPGITSDPVLAKKLADVYGNDINNVDPWLGAIAEDHLPGCSTGELTKTALVEQFRRLRDGDRYYYLNDSYLDDPVISKVIDLDNLTLSSVIQANTNITSLPNNVFFATSLPTDPTTGVWIDQSGELHIVGTDHEDIVQIDKKGKQIKVTAYMNDGKTLINKSFHHSQVNHIWIRLLGDHDQVEIDSKVKYDSIIDGGSGNDKLQAGSGSDIMLGGAGEDLLEGNKGHDILVGGHGKDHLEGGNHHDVLLGGELEPKKDKGYLTNLSSIWVSKDSYADRVDDLAAMIEWSDDKHEDNLSGESGRDLFFSGEDDVDDHRRHEKIIS